MSSRVIAGTAKGYRLKSVPGDSTRPVTDKVKEALFSILGSQIVGAAFLDLFGGTGAVGIEALSRGAAYTLFTEINRSAIKIIHENLAHTRLSDHADVLMTDALQMLSKSPSRSFNIIYIAPPQYKGLWYDTLQTLDQNPQWLTSETLVIVQIDPREKRDVLFHHLRAYDERRYGKTLLWFFETLVEEA